LVKKIIDEMDELAARFGKFCDHIIFPGGSDSVPTRSWPVPAAKPPRGARVGTGPCEKAVLDFPVAKFPARRPQFSSIDELGTRTGEGIGMV